MIENTKHQKGYDLEELLRAYFLRAGFFVLRGVPFKFEEEDLTDIDLWLYERPTGTSRRVQIVDSKSKNRPKAIERLFWTKGLSEVLNADGAYIATSDSRKSLRTISKKLGISLLDGDDIKRIKNSSSLSLNDRISDEELKSKIKSVDKSRHNKEYQLVFEDLKSSVIEGFGVKSLVRSLEAINFFTKDAIASHSNSEAANLAGRLTYFSASIVAISLDYISVESAFRTIEERREMFVNAIRYGNTDKNDGLEKLRVSIALVSKYIENGVAVAKTIDKAFARDLESIPAEIIADQAIRTSKDDTLFLLGKRFEDFAYSKSCLSFDYLEVNEKAFLGALLDYAFVDRSKFAEAWTLSKKSEVEKIEKNDYKAKGQTQLFENN